ncbi:hypothetical protein PINS_up005155 [Pythium insidiosum]|nr:hypothetical protein PINS_up005155 [Pythium insidiosum]
MASPPLICAQTAQEIVWSCIAEALCDVAARARREVSSLRRLELVVVGVSTLATLVDVTSRADAQLAFDAIHAVDTSVQLELHGGEPIKTEGTRLVVAYTADDASTWEQLQSTVATHRTATPRNEVWICLHRLLSQDAGGVDMTPSINILRSTDSVITPQELRDTLRPIRELLEQCGWRLALELLQPPPAHNAATKASSSFLAMTASINHMPFQVLLLILRWTRFHDRVYALLHRPFQRKLALLPQSRVREDVHALHQRYQPRWASLSDPSTSEIPVSARSNRPTALSFSAFDAPTDAVSASHHLVRLSSSALWDAQKAFYRELGIRAWSDNIIPFGVSSSSYLARQYARLAVDFLRQHARRTPRSGDDSVGDETRRTPNCVVWEAASGSCKFLHAFLIHFYDLIESEQLKTRFGIVPCVVASDLSEQVLDSRQAMPCFQRFLKDGRLDFARFDTASFLHGDPEDERHQLYLRCQKTKWRVGVDIGPVFFMGNYFVDSLRADAFIVSKTNTSPDLQIREVLIDSQTTHVPDMTFHLKPVDLDPGSSPQLYDDSDLNRCLAQTLERLKTSWNDASSGASLLLFPVEAMKLIRELLRDDFGVPIAVIVGDATFSHLDPIPSALFDTDTNDFEVPQLSPHPDCFCLPVDLDILQRYTSSLHCNPATATSLTPASDTFNLLFALKTSASDNRSNTLIGRFLQLFRNFSPSDCDLVWGMMGVDSGAKHLSFETQLSLLTQAAWDFDLFLVVQWPLLRHWRTSASKCSHVRDRLRDAGKRSLRMFYVLDEASSTGSTCRIMLQQARWFYQLEDFSTVIQVLRESVAIEIGSRDMGSEWLINSTYLLGLASYRAGQLASAIHWFQLSARIKPTRTRYKRWMERAKAHIRDHQSVTESA